MTARPQSWRPGFDRAAPKVWDPEKAVRINGYPKTPERYAEVRAAASARMTRLNAEGRTTRRGVPDGWAGRKAELAEIRAKGTEEAAIIVSSLQDAGRLDRDEDPRVAETFAYLVSVIRSPAVGSFDRMAAARLLLLYLKPRPTTHRAIGVGGTAEDFLSLIERA